MAVRRPGHDGNRRDANEPEIVAALLQCGASVERLSIVGGPDLLVGFRDRTHLAEVKGHKGKFTPSQLTWHADWRGAPAHVLRSADDALRMIGVLDGQPTQTNAAAVPRKRRDRAAPRRGRAATAGDAPGRGRARRTSAGKP